MLDTIHEEMDMASVSLITKVRLTRDKMGDLKRRRSGLMSAANELTKKTKTNPFGGERLVLCQCGYEEEAGEGMVSS